MRLAALSLLFAACGSVSTAGTAPTAAPVARLTVPVAAPLGESVTLDARASSSGSPLGLYKFAFGDGAEGDWTAAPTAAHDYTAIGVFTASLSVRDAEGRESTAAAAIAVVPVPPRCAADKDCEGLERCTATLCNATSSQATVTVGRCTADAECDGGQCRLGACQ